MSTTQIDELLAQYEDQQGEKSPNENVYIAYKRLADLDTCDCAKCCCCFECC